MKNKLHLTIYALLALSTIYFAACGGNARASEPEPYSRAHPVMGLASSYNTVDTQRVTINEVEYMIFAQYQGGVQVVTLDKLGKSDTFSTPPITKVSLVRQDSDLPITPKIIGANNFTDLLSIFENNLLNLQVACNAGDVLELTAAQSLELIALRSRLRRIDAQMTDILQNKKIRGIYQ